MRDDDNSIEVPMKMRNPRKQGYLFFILSVLSFTAFTFQNFVRHETPVVIDNDGTSMNDALISALKNAEKERKAKNKEITVAIIPSEESRTPAQTKEDSAVADLKDSEKD